MAIERIGLGGVLEFDSSRAVRAMGQARTALGRFTRQESQTIQTTHRLNLGLDQMTGKFGRAAMNISRAGNQMSQAIRTAGFAAVPLTAGLAFSVKQAADFEQAMANVRAVTKGLTEEEFDRLQKKAKLLGITTVFTAEESAQGMEKLGRAGFNAAETLSAIDGALAAAAAEGANSTTVIEIIARNLRAMGLEASNASGFANVLANTSASTTTDIVGLGNSLRFGVAMAKQAKIPLSDLTTIMGLLSDSGNVGSRAGTAFANMLNKLAKPSKKGAALMKKFNIQIFETERGGLDVLRTMQSVQEAFQDVNSGIRKTGFIAELFGLRGTRAVSALESALESGKLTQLLQENRQEFTLAEGAAKRMADIRLNTFHGQIKLLKAAIEGLNIELGGLLIQTLTGDSKAATQGLQGVVQVLQELNSETGLTAETAKAQGPTITGIAIGMRDAFIEFGDSVARAHDKVRAFLLQMGIDLGEGGVSNVTKMIVKFGLLVAVLAPVITAVGIFAFIITQIAGAVAALAPIFLGLAGAISGPVLIAIGVVVAAFYVFRDIVVGQIEVVSEFFSAMWENASSGVFFLIDSFRILWKDVMSIVGDIKDEFMFLKPLLVGIAQVVGKVWGLAFNGIARVVGTVVFVLSKLLVLAKTVVRFIVGGVLNTIHGLAIAMVALADSMNIPVATGLRKFAGQKPFEMFKPGQSDTDLLNERKKESDAIADAATEQKAAAQKERPIENKINLEDKRCLEVSNAISLDGREIANNQAKHKIDIGERLGAKVSPFQRRVQLEQGAIPAAGGLVPKGAT